jgi:hypothetical protein
MQKTKRSKLLVDKPTQWAIVRQSIRHWLYHSLVTIVFLAILQLLLNGVVATWDETWRSIWPLAVSVYISLLALLPLFIHDSFNLSNRFAGPIGRVRSALRDIAQGKDYKPMQFRKGDFWPEIADELNAAVATLTRKAEPANKNDSRKEDALEPSLA